MLALCGVLPERKEGYNEKTRDILVVVDCVAH